MPDLTFDALDSVPEGLREHATESNGKFVVKVVPQVKLDEFRNNNVNLSKERDTLKAYVDTVKPIVGDDVNAFTTNYTSISGIAQQVKDGTLKGTEAVQKEVDNRVGAMKEGFDRQLAEANTAAAQARATAAESDTRYKRSIVERKVTEAVVNDQSGALPGALTDILSRAYGVFQVGNDGKIVAKDGDAVMYGEDGATPMTPMEWLKKLRSAAPYFFKGSNGGGAAGGIGNGQGSEHFGGFSQEDFAKLPPQRRLEIANANAAKAGKR